MEYTRHSIADAKPGDQVWQAGEWATVGWIQIRRHYVHIRWEGSNGTHTQPINHFGEYAVRRAVEHAERPESAFVDDHEPDYSES